MSEALEAVGDVYSINGFTSEGRRNVKFYVVKDFDEQYTDDVERRIGGITFQNNTRLGAAIRHAASKLLRQESRTKLLIVLTDGRPYDHDYGDAKYSQKGEQVWVWSRDDIGNGESGLWNLNIVSSRLSFIRTIDGKLGDDGAKATEQLEYQCRKTKGTLID